MKTGTTLYIIAFLTLFFITGEVAAQTGTITGTVVDQQTGEPLSHSKVIIEATGHTVVTDEHGRYVLRRVPAGSHTLSVHSLGYSPREVRLSVGSGETREETVALSGEFAEGDRIFVQAAQRSRSRALNREYGASTIQSVITREQMNRFGDPSIQDALIRIPGVQAGSFGEINIRGAGLNRYNVSIDGQRLAATGLGTRGVDLGMFSVDLFRDLEVVKVVSPDMYADGIGGVVNLGLFDPVGSARAIEVNMGGGGNTGYSDFTGLGSRFSVRYSEELTEKLSLGLVLGQQRTSRAWESLEMDWEVADFGAGPEDVLERLAPGFNYNSRNSIGGGLQLNFQPTHSDSYYLRGFVNFSNRSSGFHKNEWIANQSHENASEINRGHYFYNVGVDESSYENISILGGARHYFNLLNLEYNLGWTQSRAFDERFSIPFQSGFVGYMVDFQDRTKPAVILEDGTLPRSSAMTIRTMDRVLSRRVNNAVSGGMQIEVPFNRVSLKIGSNALLNTVNMDNPGEYLEQMLTHLGILRLDRFNMQDVTDGRNVFNNYNLPWLVTRNAVNSFFRNNIPTMGLNREAMHLASDPLNYQIIENIYSGYGMLDLNLGDFRLLGGVRLEHTFLKNDGRLTIMDRFGRYNSTEDTTRTHNQTNLFPNAQIIYTHENATRIHLAYSRTIERAAYHVLAPYEFVNRRDTVLIRGNMEIDPVSSDNFDLRLDHNFSRSGSFSLGLFYKKISNILVFEERVIQAKRGDFKGIDGMLAADADEIRVYESMFRNSDREATLYGFEVSWQHNLGFLPGFLSNMGTFVNYTWSDSDISTDREEGIPLAYQSPHVVNAALNYAIGRFFTQVSYHWTAEYLFSAGQSGLAPSVDRVNNVYLDQYQDGWSDLSASFRFRLARNFQIWADAKNLLTNETLYYTHSRSDYPTMVNLRPAREFRIGLRYDL